MTGDPKLCQKIILTIYLYPRHKADNEKMGEESGKELQNPLVSESKITTKHLLFITRIWKVKIPTKKMKNFFRRVLGIHLKREFQFFTWM